MSFSGSPHQLVNHWWLWYLWSLFFNEPVDWMFVSNTFYIHRFKIFRTELSLILAFTEAFDHSTRMAFCAYKMTPRLRKDIQTNKNALAKFGWLVCVAKTCVSIGNRPGPLIEVFSNVYKSTEIRLKLRSRTLWSHMFKDPSVAEKSFWNLHKAQRPFWCRGQNICLFNALPLCYTWHSHMTYRYHINL